MKTDKTNIKQRKTSITYDESIGKNAYNLCLSNTSKFNNFIVPKR